MSRISHTFFAFVPAFALAGLACSSPSGDEDSARVQHADTVADGGVDADAPRDRFVGTYATVSRVVSRANVPIVGALRSITSSFGVAKVTASGDAYVIEERGCSIDIAGSGPKVTVSDATSQATPPYSSALRIVTTDEGVTYQRAEAILVGGATLADPNEALPTSANDPRVIDAEGDGKPGMTARMRSMFVSGDMYFVQRLHTSSAGTVDANGVFRGKVRAEAEQKILGATNALLRIQLATETEHDAPENEARLVKVADDFDCSALAVQKATLFAN